MSSPRGSDPQDARAFSDKALPVLRQAVADLSWLLARGYADVAASQLVGNRFQLTARQRQAVRRCAIPEEVAAERRARRVEVSSQGGPVAIDGFNVIVTLERALGGGPVFVAADGAWRDIAGMHGTWRRASHTGQVIRAVGEALAGRAVTWILDRPVSNSGRLAGSLREVAEARGWDWTVRLEDRADAALNAFDGTLATSDGGILDRCGAWMAIEPVAVAERDVWVVGLG